jgi:RND family efflux transporter MFP subunit
MTCASWLNLRTALPIAAALAASVGVAACGDDNRYVAPPPPQVTVATPVRKQVTRYLEATGNTAAINTANLVARVPGFIQKINYSDGDQVKEGAVLFIIEPESYELKLKQSQAAEQSAKASLEKAEQDFQRQSELASRGSASKAALDNATANRDTALAALKQAEINTRLAAINDGYTRVTAPFDGIVTARKVSVGEYVGSTSPTVLATIVQFTPIYVNFTLSEQDVLMVREILKKEGIKPEDLKKVPVEVGLQSEAQYPHKGTLDYAAPNVDASTGTLAVRAILPNEGRALLPGYFVRVRVPLPVETDALLVPDIALGSDQGGRYLLVVNKDNVVEQRKVEIGPVVGDMRVIEKGLNADDRVVISGILRAIPGQKVNPQTMTASAK